MVLYKACLTFPKCTLPLQAESKDASLAAGDTSSSSEQEHSAEAPAAERPPEAIQYMSYPMSAAPDGPLTTTSPIHLSGEAASSSSFSARPQPSLHLRTGASHGQLDPDLPSMDAPAAQGADSAAQKEEPWQEVRKSRRKPVRQQAASKTSGRRAQKQGRSAPDQESPAASAQHLTAAQHTDMAHLKSKSSGVISHAQPGHVAAEVLPAITENIPPQQSTHSAPKYLQPSGSQATPSSMQQKPLPATPVSISQDEPCIAPQQMPHPGLCFGTFPPEQVSMRMLAWTGL